MVGRENKLIDDVNHARQESADMRTEYDRVKYLENLNIQATTIEPRLKYLQEQESKYEADLKKMRK